MAFDYDKLETDEGRFKFNKIMDELGLSTLNLGNFLVGNSFEDKIGRLMLTKTKCLIRLYLIEGFDFAQRDIGSYSDPYLVLTIGKKIFNDRENY